MSPRPYNAGEPRPLGATLRDGGVNFALYSEHAEWVELLLFDHYDDDAPRQVIPLRGRAHRSVNTWHVFVPGVSAGQLYGYRVHGPNAPHHGLRFDGEKVLVDPYARGIVYGDNRDRGAACRPGPNVRSALKSLVVDPTGFDWRGAERPKVSPSERIIYEMHVRGFTRHPSSGVAHPGTFDGLVERIPYLVDLGITTVELLPVFQFDELAPDHHDPETGERLRDYWGYNPIGFFAPHRGYYLEDWSGMAHLTGFRDLVRALHQAGLEVILDVVFNHTSEGSAAGPTLSFRGIDNPVYYMAEPGHPAGYANYSGCGNTVNCNHPAVRRMILDSLRYWTEVMHVDGFRFDLASILSRDAAGRPLPHPPLLWEIENDPTLHHSTLIAEAWDAGGLYQVGAFPGERWREWNGQFRDDVRRFLRGDPGMSGAMARRMMASPDLYEASGRRPPQCVNFVTAHDGFTLADLVAYDRKHNTANGEGNRDGCDHEHSHGYGAEGPTDDPLVNAVRARQVRNFLTALFVAQGTPMLLSGDELGRTQGGNNNPWCQDNAISWLDWGLRSANADLHRFCRALIHRRRGHPSLRRTRYLVGHDAPADADIDGYTRVRWHGTRPDQPDWGHWNRLVAWSLTPASDDVALFVAFNAHTEALEVELPRPERGHGWLRVVDTALPSPEDISEHGAEPRVASTTYVLAPRSAIVLAASDVPPESPVSATQNLVIPPGLFGRGAD